MHLLRVRTPAPLLRRTYATGGAPFIPPASTRGGALLARSPASALPKPDSPTFYTGRAAFYDALRTLEEAHKAAETALRAVHLFPLKAPLPPPPRPPAWQRPAGIAEALGAPLTAPRYRRVLGVLAQLHELRRVAEAGREPEIAAQLDGVLELFKREDITAHLVRKPVVLDAYGRSYTLGRRKESAARVWLIATQGGPIPATTVLVNNRPLAVYFRNAIDRNRVVRPLKLAGLLGAFNVFALVRGGGTTGQAGAIAHGVAKGIVAHVPDVELILRRAKLLRRDPRMVERKKTGKAKARKRYTWVKR